MLTSDSEKKSVVFALGYFDSVHKGHIKVIESAKELANELNVSLAVFTFDGNLRGFLSDDVDKEVYTTEERVELLKSLGASEVFLAPIDFGFLSLGKIAFLNVLTKKYDVKGFVCGSDYRYGKFGSGNVENLKHYAEQNGQILKIVDTVNSEDGKRISTTLIKRYIKTGEIEKANALLTRNYSISGKVIEDRGVGKQMGIPTVNLLTDSEKQSVKEGVYAGSIKIDGEIYKAVINYGKRPTFKVEDVCLEGHILGFSGDLYGKEVRIYFDKYLRDVKKFNNPEDLKKQIEKDIERVKNGI